MSHVNDSDHYTYFNSTNWRLKKKLSKPARQHCPAVSVLSSIASFSVILRALASLPSLLFLPCQPWLPLISSSTSVSSNHLTPFQIHPHQLASSMYFTQRVQCSDPHKSMADKSMLSLFSMPLLPLIFFLLLCCLWRLELCSIKLSSLSGTKCYSVRLSAFRQTLMLALLYESFIYAMPLFKQKQQWFSVKLTLELLVL